MIDILSLNMAKRAIWSELFGTGADVALLQEAPRPPSDMVTAPAAGETWTTRGWTYERRACVARLSDRVELAPRMLRNAHEEGDALGVSREGTIAIADVASSDGERVTVASVYAAWESPTATDSMIYADASAHRLLSDLSPLITGRARVDQPLLIAGDFNLMLGYGEHGDAYWGARYDSFFARAAAMGLHMVGPQVPNGRQASPWPEELPPSSGNVPTFHHSRQTPETATRQLDYVFVSQHLVDRVSVRAENQPEEWGSSDHCRVRILIDA